MQLTHKVMGFEHTAHTVSKAECNRHRKAFRNGYHYQCHGNHDSLKEIGQEFHPIEWHPGKEIHQQPTGHNDNPYGIAGA